jgi:hypothetical protein
MTHSSELVKDLPGIRECSPSEHPFLCDPLTVLPSVDGDVESPRKVLIEIPSNDPDTFFTAVRLTSLEAAQIRLGDAFYMEAMLQISGPLPRSVPVERQYHIGEENLVDQHGTWNGLRYWFNDRFSERGSNDSWAQSMGRCGNPH